MHIQREHTGCPRTTTTNDIAACSKHSWGLIYELSGSEMSYTRPVEGMAGITQSNRSLDDGKVWECSNYKVFHVTSDYKFSTSLA